MCVCVCVSHSVLAVGSLTGQALFYLMSDSANDSTVHSHQFSQRLQCGGSALTCAVWMSNSRCTGSPTYVFMYYTIHLIQCIEMVCVLMHTVYRFTMLLYSNFCMCV